MPHTEYEVTVFAKRDISAQAGPYGAFALVGNVEGYGPGGYTGDFVEVMDLGVGSSGWTAYTARFKSSEESFEVILGLGAEAVGSATFDAVLVRDLTTRRYEYIYASGSRLAKIEYEGTVPEGQLYYDHYDIIGSPVMLTDFDGAVVWQGDYAPFGESLEAQPVSWGNPYTYMGNEDDGGLMDFGARWYDASIGRFYSADPIKNIASANVVNPYAYCANNPLRYTDKNGLSRMPASTETCDIPRVGGGGRSGGGSIKGGGSRAGGNNGYLGGEGKSGSSIDPRANDAANVPDYVRAREDNAPPKEFGTLPSGDPLRKAGDLRKESAPHYGQGSLLEGLAKVGNGAWKMAVGIQMGFCTGALALYTWHTYGIIHLGSEVVKEFVIEKEFGVPVPGLYLFGEWTRELIWEGGKEEFEGCQEISGWIIENNNRQPYVAPHGGASPAHNIEPFSFYQYQLNFKIRIRIKVGE